MSKKKDLSEDMRVEPIEGSPISLNKVVNSKIVKENPTDLKVLIENEGYGFVNDTPHLITMAAEDREMQAMYFLNLNIPMPEYLKKYLKIAYKELDEKEIEGLYNYGKTNKEFKQLVGFIQLFMGCCKHRVSAYIEEPETHLHPKRQALFMTLFYAIKEDCTPKPPPGLTP